MTFSLQPLQGVIYKGGGAPASMEILAELRAIRAGDPAGDRGAGGIAPMSHPISHAAAPGQKHPATIGWGSRRQSFRRPIFCRGVSWPPVGALCQHQATRCFQAVLLLWVPPPETKGDRFCSVSGDQDQTTIRSRREGVVLNDPTGWALLHQPDRSANWSKSSHAHSAGLVQSGHSTTESIEGLDLASSGFVGQMRLPPRLGCKPGAFDIRFYPDLAGGHFLGRHPLGPQAAGGARHLRGLRRGRASWALSFRSGASGSELRPSNDSVSGWLHVM